MPKKRRTCTACGKPLSLYPGGKGCPQARNCPLTKQTAR